MLFLRHFFSLWVLPIGLFFFSSHAESAVGTALGFSAKAASLGGMSAAVTRDGYAAFNNPALLALPSGTSSDGVTDSKTQKSNLEFSWGIVFLQPQFKSIPGPVVVQNAVTGDGVLSGSVDTEYPSVIGQAIGLSYRNSKSEFKPSVGMVMYLPIDRLAYVDSGEPFLPDYVLYRSRFQKPEFHFAFGMQMRPNWKIGAGLQLGAGLNSKVDVFLQSDATKSSSMRVSASLKTKAAPYFGTQIDFLPGWSSGITARLPLSNPQSIQVLASGRVIGDLAALDLNFNSLSAAYYEPLQIEWGNRVQLTPTARLHFQIDYAAWSRYESPNVEVNTANTTNCSPNCGGLTFSSSEYPGFTTRDTITPRVGLELSDVRVGYAYEPSIFSDTPATASHNLIDPARHRFSAGYGFKGPDFFSTLLPWTLDFSILYSVLESYSVTKSGTDIGAPGYEVGGSLFGAGISLNLSL
jgi:hypothetical protein